MANDPAWANVTTLLDFDAAGGVVDQSTSGASWSLNVNALKSSAQAKFGLQSCRFNSGGELTYPPPLSGDPSLFNVFGRSTEAPLASGGCSSTASRASRRQSLGR